MPIYEYSCSDCSGSFDVLTSFADRDNRKICPNCESSRTKVKVSVFAAFGGGGDESLGGSEPARQLGGGGCGPGCCGGSCSPN